MIVFLHSSGHGYTHAAVKTAAAPLRVEVAPYAHAFGFAELPRATYVFTDCDRLSAGERRVAAALYRCLRDGGVRVLNDPARIPSRFGLLRALHDRGINAFNAYRVEEGVRPQRWPVFLREEGGHELPLSGLLADWASVETAVEAAIANGHSLPNLVLIEYAGEPVAPGLFRRLSAYRVGEARFAALCVHDDQWLVKTGKMGIATDDLYRDEQRIARQHPYCAAVDPVFEAFGIEYGRLDFGLLAGVPQVFEINTNPTVKFPAEHPNPIRVDTYGVVNANYLAALAGIDSLDHGAPIRIASPLLAPAQEYAAAVQAELARHQSLRSLTRSP